MSLKAASPWQPEQSQLQSHLLQSASIVAQHFPIPLKHPENVSAMQEQHWSWHCLLQHPPHCLHWQHPVQSMAMYVCTQKSSQV